MATTNDLKNGLVLNLDGELWSVVEFQHVKGPLARLATRRHRRFRSFGHQLYARPR